MQCTLNYYFKRVFDCNFDDITTKIHRVTLGYFVYSRCMRNHATLRVLHFCYLAALVSGHAAAEAAALGLGFFDIEEEYNVTLTHEFWRVEKVGSFKHNTNTPQMSVLLACVCVCVCMNM